MIPGILLAAGGLGIFLLGMVVMTGALKSLAGKALRRALARFTRSPLSGAVTGATTTAIVQSSSATTVTAVGFVGAGILSFSQALGIIFGANIGTTITGWLVAILGFKLKIGELALPLVLVEAADSRRDQDIGRPRPRQLRRHGTARLRWRHLHRKRAHHAEFTNRLLTAALPKSPLSLWKSTGWQAASGTRRHHSMRSRQ